MTTKKFKETYIFTHKGIDIWVILDYGNNKITLGEPLDMVESSFKAKEWIFKDRGFEYMHAWVVILEAMQEAIKDAQKRYETENALSNKRIEKNLIDVFIAENPPKKKKR